MILSPVYLAWYKSQQNKRSQIAPYVRPHSLVYELRSKATKTEYFLNFPRSCFF